VFAGSTVFALVPARGGSRGLPGKNLRRLGGVSLVGRAVRVARGVEEIDECIVSSDSLEILDEGELHGAARMTRSKFASSDDASATDVLAEFFNRIGPEVLSDDPYVVYLQPTSPLRTSQNVREALGLLRRSGNSMCVSLSRKPLYRERLLRIDSSGTVTGILSNSQVTQNRQRLGESLYAPNGAIYIFRYSDFLDNQQFPIDGAVPYFMGELESIDIDSEEDFRVAESLMGIV
jgi:CMP-N,N'-diacetyllegionaminic acid synthase